MAGVKGRSGRHPKPSTIVNRAMAIIDKNFEAIMQQCVNNAIKGDKESIFYCIDRKLGRPSISVDQRIRGVIGITADERRIAIMEASQVQDAILGLPAGIIEDNGKGMVDVPSFTVKDSSANQDKADSHE